METRTHDQFRERWIDTWFRLISFPLGKGTGVLHPTKDRPESPIARGRSEGPQRHARLRERRTDAQQETCSHNSPHCQHCRGQVVVVRRGGNTGWAANLISLSRIRHAWMGSYVNRCACTRAGGNCLRPIARVEVAGARKQGFPPIRDSIIRPRLPQKKKKRGSRWLRRSALPRVAIGAGGKGGPPLMPIRHVYCVNRLLGGVQFSGPMRECCPPARS